MMDDTLEEDIPEDFKGGTLQISREDCGKIVEVVENPDKKCVAESMRCEKKAADASSDGKVLQLATLAATSENADDFFTFREGVIERAVRECLEQIVDLETDGPLLATFLLTEINLWDNDKERLLLLTPKTLINVKYDFIALKRMEYKKLPLNVIDTVVIGELVYPNGSLIPRINGLADGFSDVLQSCLFDRWSKSGGERNIPNVFHNRERNVRGIRLMWNKGKPLGFGYKWNPFSNSVPFSTFTFHPLYFHKDCRNEKQKQMHDVEEFMDRICEVITSVQRSRSDNVETCIIHHRNILLESYLGITSIIHNRNALGFYKVRGKFSF